jgi:hypothetical protein
MLTAGHCVHAGSGAPWYGSFTFILACTCTTSACTGGRSEPYGNIGWSWATTYWQGLD